MNPTTQTSFSRAGMALELLLGGLLLVRLLGGSLLADEPAVRLTPRAESSLSLAEALDRLQRLTQCTPEQRDSWLGELEHDDHAVREAAMQRLAQLPIIPRDAWSRQLATATAERRWRLRHVLEHQECESAQLFRHVLDLLALNPTNVNAGDWLTAALLLERSDLRDEFALLLRAHVPDSHLPAFRQAAREERRAGRLAAAIVLARGAAAEDQPLLEQLLRDRDEQLALLAALGIAQRGDARAIPTLIRLLDAEPLDVRRASAAWLGGITGQEFDYSPFASSSERQLAMARWRQWSERSAGKLVLQPPRRVAVSARGDLGTTTLVATGGLGRICEFDPQGNVLWQVNVQAWSAEKLPGGNVLVASHWENRVCEYNRQGRVVWELDQVNAIRAKPLPGGRVLVVDLAGNRVLEADRRGQILWQHETPDQCFDAERLHGGHTLFACPNLIREVTPEGSTVRQWPVEGRINSVQVLPSGRLLAANYGTGSVVELDDQNRIVWEHKIARPSDAFRLPGGRTLITTAEQIVEVDPQGRQIRQISPAVNGCARQ